MAKENLKNLAISLRKNGLSYSEILKEIPVAKSTLSLWLRSVGLSNVQKERLTLKKLESAQRGGKAKRKIRIESEIKIKSKASEEIGVLSDREIWIAGIMLYWAEGCKQKEMNVSVGIKFSNSDPKMLVFFIYWLKKYFNVFDDDIVIELYLHENFKDKKDIYINYWSNILNYPVNKFDKVYFKKNKITTLRKNINENYHGQINVRIKRSTNLNRKITGWIDGFNKK